MAKKKPTFPEPLCSTCPHHTILGNAIFGTRVCMGVKSKKGKRFRSSDPKYKPPKWCPKRISPRICRIYRLGSEEQALMEADSRQRYDPQTLDWYPLIAHRYAPTPRLEFPISMSPKEFYEQAQRDLVDSVLEGVCLEYGDVIEIDDGLRPYYFYYYDSTHLFPTLGLETVRQLKGEKH
jgi:hypothetical protein